MVHNARSAGGGFAGAGAGGEAAEGIGDGLNEGLGDVGRIGDGEFLDAGVGFEGGEWCSAFLGDGGFLNARGGFEANGVGREVGERKAAVGADELEEVFARGAGEIPGGDAGHAGGGAEAHGERVFDGVGRGEIGGVAGDIGERAEEKIEKVERVRAEVKKEAAASVGGVEAPGKLGGRGAVLGFGVVVADAGELADGAGVEEFLDLEEAGLGAAVIGDEEWEAGAGEGGEHLVAFGGVAGHGFFDIGGFAGGANLEGVLEVKAGRSGNVDGVNFGVADEGFGVVIPFGNTVAAGVVRGEGGVATHDGDELGAGGFLEAGTAFDFGNVAATENAPADGVTGFPSGRGGREIQN